MSADIIKLRVFLEGIYIPYWAEFSCVNSDGPEGTANLVLPASNKLKPEEIVRAKLHVFWSNKAIRHDGRSLDEWPLLWEGELAGDGQSKGFSHRNTVLNFESYKTYFDQIMFYWVLKSKRNNDVDTFWGSTINQFYGLHQVVINTNDAIVSQENNLIQQIKAKADELQGGGDPSSGYIEAIVDFLRFAILNSNDYYTSVSNKLRLTGRMAMYKDPDLADLIDASNTAILLEQQCGEAMPVESVFNFITRILNLFQYKILFIPSPKYHKNAPKTQGEVEDGKAVDVVLSPADSKAAEDSGDDEEFKKGGAPEGQPDA